MHKALINRRISDYLRWMSGKTGRIPDGRRVFDGAVRENWTDSGWEKDFDGAVRENWADSGREKGIDGDVRENWADSGREKGFDGAVRENWADSGWEKDFEGAVREALMPSERSDCVIRRAENEKSPASFDVGD